MDRPAGWPGSSEGLCGVSGLHPGLRTQVPRLLGRGTSPFPGLATPIQTCVPISSEHLRLLPVLGLRKCWQVSIKAGLPVCLPALRSVVNLSHHTGAQRFCFK